MINKILVTGGTGKTGRYVVEHLQNKGLTPRIATRSPIGENTVRFDWSDPTCFEQAFETIESIYLVAPTDTFDSIGAMKDALNATLDAGIKRFVLLSASSLEEGGPMMGAVHAWLRANVQEWAVLRPSWFMQNLTEGQHCEPIKKESIIYSATKDGRMGFIAAQDIANCAATLLTTSEIENTDYVITGPEALSYDLVAETLSSHLGRTIIHKHLLPEEVVKRYQNLGFSDDYANGLSAMDVAISNGSEDHVTNNVRIITGVTPMSINAFVQSNIDFWSS